jgi:hypothetical protein
MPKRFRAKALLHVLTLNALFNLSAPITSVVGAVILFPRIRVGQPPSQRPARLGSAPVR